MVLQLYQRMFPSGSSSRGFLSMKSPWAALCFLLLILPLYELLYLKKQIGLDMIHIAEKQNPTEAAKKMDVISTHNATAKVAEPTTSSPTDIAAPEPLAPNLPNLANETIPTAWCMLDHDNTNKHFRHFPHALQSLAPCWSFFCRVREERGVDAPCGIYIKYPPRLPWKSMSSWTRQLVDHMGCQVVVQSQENTPVGKVIVDGDVQYRPPNERVKPYIFFEKKEHVQLLQARVLGDAVVTNQEKKKGGIRIGLLQRIRENPKRPSRIFLNLQIIRSQLQAAFPNATLVETDMRHFSLQEQALWWHQNDVVVAAHGAAITNCIFLRNHNESTATVIEVYPDGFHPIIFGALMKTVGVHRLTITQNASISIGKNADLRPDPKLVVELVRQALQDSDLHTDRKSF